jgi:complex iron-sulfur molybdoenzyme family reductase subunit beta
MSEVNMGRQLITVIDTNKCLGCQTCTVACKNLWTSRPGMAHIYWNNVETRPGQGYPRGWEKLGGGWKAGKPQPASGKIPSIDEYGHAWNFNYEEALYEGKADRLKPSPQPSWGPNWEEDVGAGTYPDAYYFYLPRVCNQCTKPACVAACPVKAIYKRGEDGIVLVDEKRCQGIRACIQACPYKKVYYNSELRISQKCIGCYPRLETGVPPACLAQCPGRMRWVGYADDMESSAYKLVKVFKVGLRLHPEFGTEPSVYYIPPLPPPRVSMDGEILKGDRIPVEYLAELFGDDAKQGRKERIKRATEVLDLLRREKAKKAAGQGSELMDILVARRESARHGPFTRDPHTLKTG